MDSTTLIRVIAGVLALVVLGIIIWRRKRRSIDD
jgi:LPXTG-motif cell wall-anchored protein